MKKVIVSFILILIFINVNAQEWLTDFNQAQKIAKQENKSLILSFQGSDWCAPCIKLEKEYFSNPEFVTYAKEHFVMLKVDFPRRKKNRLSKEQTKHNNNLAEKYNKQGHFPLIVVLSPEGKVLKKTGYDDRITVSDFIRKLDII